jgi:hypothetical protein
MERSSTMSHKQVLQLVIAVILVISFLVGCGGSTPTPVSEAPAATSAPEQAATLTPEPPTPTPELPTATPIPPTATPTLEVKLDEQIPLYEGAKALESGANPNLDQAAQEIVDKLMADMIDPNVNRQVRIFTLPAEVTGNDVFSFYKSEGDSAGWKLGQVGVVSGWSLYMWAIIPEETRYC